MKSVVARVVSNARPGYNNKGIDLRARPGLGKFHIRPNSPEVRDQSRAWQAPGRRKAQSPPEGGVQAFPASYRGLPPTPHPSSRQIGSRSPVEWLPELPKGPFRYPVAG